MYLLKFTVFLSVLCIITCDTFRIGSRSLSLIRDSKLYLDFLDVLENLYARRVLYEDDMMMGDQPDVSNVTVREVTKRKGSAVKYSSELMFSDSDEDAHESAPLEDTNGTMYQTDSFKMSLEASKKLHLEEIKKIILDITGHSDRAVPTGSHNFSAEKKDILHKLQAKLQDTLPEWPPAHLVQKLQSLHPTCNLPKHIEKEELQNGLSMNIYFNISFPKPSLETTINIRSANLRLYKIVPKLNETLVDMDSSAAELEDLIRKSNMPQNVATATLISAIAEDKQIRVAVYYKSLKKKRVKKKLLDTKMLAILDEKWTEWNIKKSVKTWQNSSKNYGLLIEVEDEDGKQLPAHMFFANLNCSNPNETLAKPIPGLLIENAKGAGIINDLEGFNKLYDGNVQLPTLEISTEEVPNDAIVYNYTKNAFEKHIADTIRPKLDKNRKFSMFNDQHRLRHDHHTRNIGLTNDTKNSSVFSKTEIDESDGYE